MRRHIARNSGWARDWRKHEVGGMPWSPQGRQLALTGASYSRGELVNGAPEEITTMQAASLMLTSLEVGEFLREAGYPL